MSDNILNAILYSSKDTGIDPTDNTDHDVMFYRLGIVQSDKVPYVVEAIENVKNFARTVEPRLRPYLVNDARTYRNMISSFGSVKGKTLSMVNTTTQQHTLTQKNVQQKKGWASMFNNSKNNQGQESQGGQ